MESYMRKPAAFLGLLVAATVLVACAAGRAPLIGWPPGSTSAPDLSGRLVDLTAGDGTVRVVDFWATWCEPCLGQLDGLERLARVHRGRGLRVYAVAVDGELAPVQALRAGRPGAITVLWDRGGFGLADRLGVQRLPTTFVLDRRGAVRSVHSGAGPEEERRLEAEVLTLLAEPVPPATAPPP
jgi:thiol-disulfide isomerase/thioredoxin